MRGKKMAEVWSLIAIFAVIGIYGAWRYASSETTDYNAFVTKANHLEGRISSLEEDFKSVQTLIDKSIQEMLLRDRSLQTASSEIKSIQEHLAVLQKEQIGLYDKIAKRRPVIKFQGLVPVEIVPGNAKPPAKKKQTHEVSR